MISEVITISPEASIRDAVDLLLMHQISGLPVVDTDQKLLGIIDERDIIIAFDLVGSGVPVEAVMHPCFRSVPPDLPLVEVHELFRSLGLRRLAVCDNQDRLIGIVARRDLLRLHMDASIKQNRFRRETMRRPSSCFELGPMAARRQSPSAIGS